MTRLRRAMLFMPGDSQRKIEKGAGLDVDSVIMDLEDGVALSQKEAARETTREALIELDFGRTERVVRVNTAESGLQSADLEATIAGRPDAYMVPKVETAHQLQQLSDEIRGLERLHNIPKRSIQLIPIVETALGVVNLREIVHAGQRVVAVAFGAEDLASSIGATRTPAGQEVHMARSAVVLYAKAFNLQALDTPYINVRDLDGLRADAEISRIMGFDGRLCIHPAQVEVVVGVFTPSAEEVAQAQALIDAYEAHQAEGTGVFVYEGRMIDTPMILAARNVLARAGVSSGSG